MSNRRVMPNEKDYAALPLDALLAEQKDMKRNQLLSAAAIGFLVGVMAFGLVKNGFRFLFLAIPSLLIVGIYKNSRAQKQTLVLIGAEIEARRST